MLVLAKVALAPLLLWQGARVRRTALKLPEAAGPRSGVAGSGGLKLRLLIVGDSSGAGVGAATQSEALAGRLSAALAERLGGSVHWQLLARTGNRTADSLQQLRDASSLEPADVMVTALGVNDAVGQVSASLWTRQLAELHQLAVARLGVRYSLHSAVPPMHAFPLLPQPLRWLLGAQAMRLNRALVRDLADSKDRGVQAAPANLHQSGGAAALMAPDGFHPNPAGYKLWADALAERIAAQITLSSR